MAPDELTGLMTRAEILDQLKNALALASQQNQPLTAVYVDCHHLLHINNTYGHVAGDEFISIVGDVLRETARGATRRPLGAWAGTSSCSSCPVCPSSRPSGWRKAYAAGWRAAR